MRHSDVFDSFVKIAQKKGLISQGDHAEHTEKNLDNPRWDSLSIEQIGKLYGVKPDAPEDMKYKRNIIEDAHPDPLVISPSYDKLNGLIENENEGQDIRIHISLKEPDGHLVNRKYAEQQLVLSLVRVANDLDNRNEEELRVLADACLLQVAKKKILKQAVAPLLLIAPIVAVLGGLYFQQHFRAASQGFQQDQQKLLAEIDDLLNSTSSWGVGYEYKANFINLVKDLRSKVVSFYRLEKQIEPLINQLQTPKTRSELEEIAQQPETQELMRAYAAFSGAAQELEPYLEQVMNDFSSEMFKQQQIANKGFLSGLVDKTQVLHGGWGMIKDDFDDVKYALQTYMKDIGDILEALKAAESFKQNAQRQLASAHMFDEKSEAPQPAPATAPQAVPASTTAPRGREAPPWADLETEFGDLSKGLI